MRWAGRTRRRRRSATTRSSTPWSWPRPPRTSPWSRSTRCRAADVSEQRRLLHLPLRPGRRLRQLAAQVHPVAQVAPPLDRALADHLAQPLALALRQVGAARVQRLVARHQIRPLRLQPVEPNVACLAAQVQADAAYVHRAGLFGEPQDLV